MTVTASDALAFIGGSSSDTAEVTRCLAVAVDLVSTYVGTRTADVPAEVVDQATLEVVAAVYRRAAQPGQAGSPYATALEGTVVVREPRDPMTVAVGILDRYLRRGLA